MLQSSNEKRLAAIHRHRPHRSNWTNNSDWEKKAAERKKREEEEDKMRWTPTLINRKGDCPALKELNILKKKLAAIATREYESELPEIKRCQSYWRR